MLTQGDTFLLGNHLFIIISDPSANPDKMVLGALTTYETYKDQSCVLQAGEHSFIRHMTCVSYDFLDDMIVPVWEIEKRIRDGIAKQMDRVTDDVLRKILDGAQGTARIPNASWIELNSQGLID